MLKTKINQGIPLHKLVRLEWQKIARGKKLVLMTVVFFVILLIFFYAENSLNRMAYSPEQKASQCTNMAKAIQQKISLLSAGSNTEDEKAAAAPVIADYKRQYDLYGSLESAFAANDWKEALNIQNQLDTDTLEGRYQVGAPNSVSPKKLTQEQIQSQIEFRQYLVSNGIEPIDVPNAVSGLNGLQLALGTLLPLFLPILVLSLSADMLSGEAYAGTFKFYLQQPVPRLRIYAAKFLASVLAAALPLAAGGILLFGVSSAVNGTGSPNYPVRAGGAFCGAFPIGGTQFVTMLSFLLQAAPLLLCAVLFYVSFGLLVSALTKSPSASISISIVFPVVFYLLGKNMNFALLRFTPFAMADISAVLFGESSLPAAAACIVLVIFSLCCSWAAASILKRKDFLC